MVFVTTTTVERIPVFKSQAVCESVVAQLEETSRYFAVSLVGYVLMPSHLHALLGLPKIEFLSKFMQSFKSLTSRRLKNLFSDNLKNSLWNTGRFRLWRPRFDDVVITSEKQFRIKLDYIHNNPVKAGLTTKPEDWKYSSAYEWLGDSKRLIGIDKYFEWVK